MASFLDSHQSELKKRKNFLINILGFNTLVYLSLTFVTGLFTDRWILNVLSGWLVVFLVILYLCKRAEKYNLAAIAINVFLNIAGIVCIPLIGEMHFLTLGLLSLLVMALYISTSQKTQKLLVIISMLGLIAVRIHYIHLYGMDDITVLILDFACGTTGSIIILLVFETYSKSVNRYASGLKDSIQFLQNISDTNPHLLFARNEEDKLIFVNQAVETWTETKKEDLIGKKWSDISALADLKVEDLSDSSPPADKRETKIQLPHPSGTPKWLKLLEVSIENTEHISIGTFSMAMDITEQELFEKKLTLSADKYRNIFENTPVGMAVIRKDQFMRTNQALAEISGYTKEELISIPLKKIIDPEDFDYLRECTKNQIFQGAPPKDHELTFRHKEGSNRHVLVKIAPLLDLQGEFVESFLTISDITDLKNRDRELAQSLSQLEATLESTAEGIVVTNTQGAMLKYNQKFLKMLDYEPSENMMSLEERVMQEFTHRVPDVQAFFSRLQAIVTQVDQPSYDEITFTNGTTLERHSYPQWLGDEIIGRVWSFRDITDQKIHAKALTESEEKYRNLFDLAPMGLLLLDFDKEHTGVQCNKRMEALFKASERQLLASHTLDWSPEYQPDGMLSKEKFKSIIQRYKAAQIPYTYEWRFQNSEKEIFDCEVSYVPIAMGDRVLTMLMIMDITDRKQQEHTIKQQLIDLNRQNQQLTEFSYIISHNFRSSVANIVGLAENFEYEQEVNHVNQQLMKMMNQVVGRLDTSIRDLQQILDVKGMTDAEFAPIDITCIIQKVLEELGESIQSTISTLIIDIPPNLELLGLSAYYQSIFYNLLSNAIKYRHPDRNPEIHLITRVWGDSVEITIEDNGLGINLQKYGGHVFSLYKRFHDHVDGKGLGLYLVKTQTEAMGGKISLVSEVDQGSTFVLTFPLAYRKVESREDVFTISE
ncbi:MAG: PAS domain S-box protein [Bacteroidota bacterium]